MNFLEVPEDVYTTEKNVYWIRYYPKGEVNYVSKKITKDGMTNTSEYFLYDHISEITSIVGEGNYKIYADQNFITVDYINLDGGYMSTVDGYPETVYWMYPGRDVPYPFGNTWHFPVTRTISIIINSNTLPVYSVPEINVDVRLGSNVHIMNIPANNYTYSSMNNLIGVFLNQFGDQSWKASTVEYNGTNYFELTNYYINRARPQTVFYDNEEFSKYYGLLHRIVTHSKDDEFIDGPGYRSQGFSPNYRALHVPEGKYLPNDFINYINNNSKYHYTYNDISGQEYTQFLAKIVDNDIVLYTTDNTEFIINPICKMNTYQETNYATEHKLCPCSEGIKWDNLNKRYYIGDTVNITGTLIGPFEGLSASGLPDGLSFDPVTCSITGTISKNNKVGEYTITITTTTIDDPLIFNIYIDTRKYLIYYKGKS